MSTESVNTTNTTQTATDLASYQQFALEQQAQNNAWSAAQAQKQMDFQKEMSNTAHQREVADLKAAGLNPILSANSGASVPNGAAGDTDTSAAGNVGAVLQQVLQAQSAREVAGMYNAATIAAATIAANASMYNTDENNKTQREYPNTLEGVAAKAIADAQHMVGDGVDPNSPRGAYWNGFRSAGSGTSMNNKLASSFGSILKKLPNSSQIAFAQFLKRNGYNSVSQILTKPTLFARLFSQFVRTYNSRALHKYNLTVH